MRVFTIESFIFYNKGFFAMNVEINPLHPNQQWYLLTNKTADRHKNVPPITGESFTIWLADIYRLIYRGGDSIRVNLVDPDKYQCTTYKTGIQLKTG